MTDYMLTAHSKGLGWRDIEVLNAGDMLEAIAAAEKVTGCMVSHGRGYVGRDFDPGVTIDLESGEITEHHTRKAKPLVWMGPHVTKEVQEAIAAALRPAKPAPSERAQR